MNTFARPSAFLDFQQEVSRRRRYFLTAESERFLGGIARSCKGRTQTIEAGEIFWRAQVGHEWVLDPQRGDKVRSPHSVDRMKPLQDRAYEGRVNPKGIPCLYFATTRDVAMSEVRPWIGSVVTVARFRTSRRLTIVDCSKSSSGNSLRLDESEADDVEASVWAHIDHAFSAPVTRSDDRAVYAATQILAERFRSHGYEGVVYRSAFSAEGRNVALFDLDCARQIDSSMFEVRNAVFEFVTMGDEQNAADPTATRSDRSAQG